MRWALIISLVGCWSLCDSAMGDVVDIHDVASVASSAAGTGDCGLKDSIARRVCEVFGSSGDPCSAASREAASCQTSSLKVHVSSAQFGSTTRVDGATGDNLGTDENTDQKTATLQSDIRHSSISEKEVTGDLGEIMGEIEGTITALSGQMKLPGKVDDAFGIALLEAIAKRVQQLGAKSTAAQLLAQSSMSLTGLQMPDQGPGGHMPQPAGQGRSKASLGTCEGCFEKECAKAPNCIKVKEMGQKYAKQSKGKANCNTEGKQRERPCDVDTLEYWKRLQRIIHMPMRGYLANVNDDHWLPLADNPGSVLEQAGACKSGKFPAIEGSKVGSDKWKMKPGNACPKSFSRCSSDNTEINLRWQPPVPVNDGLGGTCTSTEKFKDHMTGLNICFPWEGYNLPDSDDTKPGFDNFIGQLYWDQGAGVCPMWHRDHQCVPDVSRIGVKKGALTMFAETW